LVPCAGDLLDVVGRESSGIGGRRRAMAIHSGKLPLARSRRELLVRLGTAACSGAGVKAAACSGVRVEAVVCFGAGVENGSAQGIETTTDG
jgi:hypothetical protein